jgi:hypothetical protein
VKLAFLVLLIAALVVAIGTRAGQNVANAVQAQTFGGY